MFGGYEMTLKEYHYPYKDLKFTINIGVTAECDENEYNLQFFSLVVSNNVGGVTIYCTGFGSNCFITLLNHTSLTPIYISEHIYYINNTLYVDVLDFYTEFTGDDLAQFKDWIVEKTASIYDTRQNKIKNILRKN